MRRTLAILGILCIMAIGCARQPTPDRSSHVIQKYFKKYAKKYKDSVYGQNPVTKVEVTSQQEVHKNLVAVEAFLTLKDGTVQRIHATVEKGPAGWRFISWENATNG